MPDTMGVAAISCLQINLNHSKLAQDCIANKIRGLNCKQSEFIICVQEPYIYMGQSMLGNLNRVIPTVMKIVPEQRFTLQRI